MTLDEYDWHWHWTAHLARGSVPSELAQSTPCEHRPHWLDYLRWLAEHGYYDEDRAATGTTVPPERAAAPEPRPPMTAGDDGMAGSYLP